MSEPKELEHADGPAGVKPRTSRLAIASFTACIMTVICTVFLYYEQSYLQTINSLLHNPPYAPWDYAPKTVILYACFTLPCISFLFGFAAIIRIILSSKKRTGYILVITSVTLALIASFWMFEIIVYRLAI
jgi:hypothetical protein